MIDIQQAIRPTRKQKIEISNHGLNPNNWLIERDMPKKLVLVNRKSNKLRELRR